MNPAEEFYNKKFHPKKITVVSKHTVIELMESYAKELHGTFWFDIFNKRYPDEKKEIFKKTWVSHFGHSVELNKQLEICLTHDYIFEAMESYAKEHAKEAELLLIKAIEIIKTWHNADEVWDIYYNHSPEMKEIREWLNQQTKP